MNINSPLSNYENQWVALSSDYKNVLVSAKTISALNQKIVKSKLQNKVIITHIYPFSTILCPLNQ